MLRQLLRRFSSLEFRQRVPQLDMRVAPAVLLVLGVWGQAGVAFEENGAENYYPEVQGECGRGGDAVEVSEAVDVVSYNQHHEGSRGDEASGCRRQFS